MRSSLTRRKCLFEELQYAFFFFLVFLARFNSAIMTAVEGKYQAYCPISRILTAVVREIFRILLNFNVVAASV